MYSDERCHCTISNKHTLNEKMGNVSKCPWPNPGVDPGGEGGEGAHDFKEKGQPWFGRTVRIS